MEPFEVLGTWWFPGEEKKLFAGNLKFSLEGGIAIDPIQLFYFDIFVDRYRKYGVPIAGGISFGTPYSEDVLLGYVNREPVTLLSCQVDSGSISARIMIRGTHFKTLSEAAFPKYSLGFKKIDEWGASGKLSTNETDGRFSAHYDLPTAMEKRTKIELHSAIIEVFRHFRVNRALTRTELVEDTEFWVLPKVSEEAQVLPVIDVVNEYSYLLRDFLMLSTWKHVRFAFLRGWKANDHPFQPYQIFWMADIAWSEPIDSPLDWVFTLENVRDELPKILRNWEAKRDQFEPLFKKCLKYRYLPVLLRDDLFSSYMQALEAYAKQTRGNKRLVNLINDMPSIKHLLDEIIGKDLDQVVQLWVDTRNEYVHEGVMSPSNIEVEKYVRQLELIILLTVFHDLGFSPGLITRISSKPVFRARVSS